MREVTIHKHPGLDELIRIELGEEPVKDDAPHKYDISLRVHNEWANVLKLKFQQGPYLPEKDGTPHIPNGITIEALLAICIDRLQEFQKTPTSCRENAIAITHIETALLWLHKRTRDRIARGVEGTKTP